MMHRKRDKRSFRERYNRFMKELGSKQTVEVVAPTLSWRVSNSSKPTSNVYVAKVLYHPLIHGYSPLFSGISYRQKLVYIPKTAVYQGKVVSQTLPLSQV